MDENTRAVNARANAKEAAFPHTGAYNVGLTKREYMATAFMASLVSAGYVSSGDCKYETWAVNLADALLAELAK